MIQLSEILIRDVDILKNLSFIFKLPLFNRFDFLWCGSTPILFKYEIFIENNPNQIYKIDEFDTKPLINLSNLWFTDSINTNYSREIFYEYPMFDREIYINKLFHLIKLNTTYFIKIFVYLENFEKIILSNLLEENKCVYDSYLNYIFSNYNFSAKFIKKYNSSNEYRVEKRKRGFE
jgi:hypothetical protein